MQFLKALARNLAGGRRAKAADAAAAQAAVAAYGRLTSGDTEGAAALIAPLLSRQPGSADLLLVQGLIHKARGEYGEAAAWLRAAVDSRDDFGAAWCQLGAVLSSEEALAAYERAAACEPRSAAIHQNLGITRYRLRDVRGAIAALTQALAIDPGLEEARFNLAEALLAAGDFERGWAEYEHRPHLAAAMQSVTLPRRTAQCAGDRVAVVAEQGLGDVLLLARLLPRLRGMTRSVAVFVQPALVRLFRQSNLADEVYPLEAIARASQEHYDSYIPFMSLAHTVGLRIGELEPDVPYLRTGEESLAPWRSRVGSRTDVGLRVGLVWGGNPGRRRDSDRSIPVARFAALASVDGLSLYKLQLGRPDLGQPEFAMTDFTGHLADFADTAALMQQLDLVISVDTAAAHLAGALGTPVWVLCPFCADWRWVIGGKDAPWYASARVLRPDRTADWPRVIDKVRDALTAGSHGNMPRPPCSMSSVV